MSYDHEELGTGSAARPACPCATRGQPAIALAAALAFLCGDAWTGDAAAPGVQARLKVRPRGCLVIWNGNAVQTAPNQEWIRWTMPPGTQTVRVVKTERASS